jgi:hypothetical protein
MGNYQPEMSYRGLVTHNSNTQVAAEMGMTAFACYTMFIVTPLRKLGQIARETFETRRDLRFYYLTLRLQASLIAYLVSSIFLSVAYVWYGVQLLSYKLMRYLVPFFLMGLFVASAVLAPGSLAYRLVFAVQVAGYACPALA